ncbi:type II secretion system F family protein [Pelagibius sp. Alg239-R121]|uniref:type II secretion system F family protein n=1 Tax=Pelagibius sp. Alg239-R121 TaxID=2993448 RepID=UPI0024A65B67|nr:type II secretion system F family protein [Pelagibius sp. Alg239-R121]
MPLFRYKSIAGSGEVTNGELDAADKAAVVSNLRQQGHIPVKIEAAGRWSFAGSGFLQQEVFASGGISADEISTLTREVATLLGAGLTLERSLEILAGLGLKPKVKKVVDSVLEQVRGGTSLADALDLQKGAFPKYYRSMVRAGEAGSTLETVLRRLADFMEQSRALSRNVRSALIYPIFLLVTAGISVVVLITYVVPTFQPLFDDAGAKIPVITQIVIGFGDLARVYWWIPLLLGLLGGLGIRLHMARPAGRLWWHAKLLRLPLIGGLWTRIDVARFSRTLATLLSNGVPLLAALALVKDVLGNAALGNAVSEAEPEVKAGRGLSKPLSETGLFPDLALQLLQVGEESGHLEDMLFKLADIYDQESQASIQRMLALLVPVLTLGLGVLIALIISSILLALFSINQLVV